MYSCLCVSGAVVPSLLCFCFGRSTSSPAVLPSVGRISTTYILNPAPLGSISPLLVLHDIWREGSDLGTHDADWQLERQAGAPLGRDVEERVKST